MMMMRRRRRFNDPRSAGSLSPPCLVVAFQAVVENVDDDADADGVQAETKDEGVIVVAQGQLLGPGGHCSPRHRATFNSRDEGSKRVGSSHVPIRGLHSATSQLNLSRV